MNTKKNYGKIIFDMDNAGHTYEVLGTSILFRTHISGVEYSNDKGTTYKYINGEIGHCESWQCELLIKIINMIINGQEVVCLESYKKLNEDNCLHTTPGELIFNSVGFHFEIQRGFDVISEHNTGHKGEVIGHFYSFEHGVDYSRDGKKWEGITYNIDNQVAIGLIEDLCRQHKVLCVETGRYLNEFDSLGMIDLSRAKYKREQEKK